MKNAGIEVDLDHEGILPKSKEELLEAIQGEPRNIPQDTLDMDMNLRQDAVKKFIDNN